MPGPDATALGVVPQTPSAEVLGRAVPPNAAQLVSNRQPRSMVPFPNLVGLDTPPILVTPGRLGPDLLTFRIWSRLAANNHPFFYGAATTCPPLSSASGEHGLGYFSSG
jgi:hypothetical protein